MTPADMAETFQRSEEIKLSYIVGFQSLTITQTPALTGAREEQVYG